MAEIKIRRKRQVAWWPVLLLLLVPLAWYLVHLRTRSSDTALERDTGTAPAVVPLPREAQQPPPAAPSGPVTTTSGAATGTPRRAPAARP